MSGIIELDLKEDLIVSKIIEQTLEKLKTARGRLLEQKADDMSLLTVSTQVSVLEDVKSLINERNKQVCMQLSKLVEDMPVEVKTNFVENIMKYAQI